MAEKVFLLFLFSFVGCKTDSPQNECNEGLISKTVSFASLTQSLPQDVVMGLAKEPTSEGALGRNKDGYFHVRFQVDIGFLSSYAVRFQNDNALDNFIHATEFSFTRQKASGDFDLIIPANLLYLGQPSDGDLTSGISFFMSALGSSLVLLEQSNWYMNRPIDALTNRLNNLKSKFQLAIDFLKTKKEILMSYDALAPNRLFFDAVAFYSMGVYLNDSTAKAIGLEFVTLALGQQNAEGFFIEGGGFDSSYNGVSLRLGMTLLGIIPSTESVYPTLQKAISCCAQWQASRILNSGEISEEGNTRVYSGGESFLGQEKSIAWTDTLLAFYFIETASSNERYNNLAQKIKAFYN